MDYSHLHEEAIQKTLSLLQQGDRNILHSIKEEFSSNEKAMSEGQWNYYNKHVLSVALKHIQDETVLKNFLSDFSLLDNTFLKTCLDDNEVSIENISLILEKMKEECLKKACREDYDDLMDFFLSKDKSMANFRFMDGTYVLQYAAKYGSEEIIKCLLNYGAVIDCEDDNGLNVLHYAALNKNDAIWKVLSSEYPTSKLAVRKDAAGKYPIEYLQANKNGEDEI